ncbi:MAG TPA: oligosaccharide flippase family protein [Burkholderiales bacterium]|nr:oligosaccharide flippase family protein [Burkholderiales bacterium]
MSSDSIFKPAFVLMSGRAVGLAAAFAIPVVLARLFDPSVFGTYKQLFLIYGSLYSIAQIGMSEGLFYFLPSAGRDGGHYAFNAIVALGAAGMACLVLLWSAQTNIAVWLNNDALIGHIPLIGIFLLLTLITSVLEIVMTARKHHLYAFGAFALSDAVRAIFLIVPAVWLGGLEALLWGGILFAGLRLSATLVYLVREYDGAFVPNPALARRQAAYAAPFFIYVLVDVMQAQLHMYAVSSRFDAATFAIYAVGCLSIPLVDFLTSSTGNVMMVRMREQFLAGVHASLLAVWNDTTRKLALVFVPLIGALLVVSHELIVVLFTDTYERSVPIFMVWASSILFAILLTDCVLRVFAEMRFLILLSFIKLAFVAATIGWFMSTFDLLGAILVVLATVVVAKTIAMARIKTVLRCRLSELLPWRSLAAILAIGAAAAAPALLVRAVLLGMPTLPLMLIAGSVYVGVYAALIWRWGPLGEEEKFTLMRTLQRPFAAALSRV